MKSQTKGTPRKHPSGKGVAHTSSTSLAPEQLNTKLLLLVALLVGIFYIPALFNGFTNWDDNGYITGSTIIKSLSFDNIKKIFTTPVMGNYHPFTVLNYAIEYKLVKAEPFLYHLTSVFFHVINSSLVFILAFKLSKSNITSLVTALLFGLHPLHVESVAWVSERKDVLYACFFLLSIICYIDYTVGKRKPKLWLSYACFLVSLLCKGQGASLPVLLFIIDYWLERPLNKELFIEKIPHFILAFVFGYIAIKAQQHFGYMAAMHLYSFTDRLFFAFNALVLYLGKCILPIKLSCFYPFPPHKTTLIYLSPLIIGLLAFVIYRTRRNTRLYVFGFLFFLISIALVLQVIAVGGAIISERYTYIPYIGLFFIAGTLVQVLIKRSKQQKTLILTLSFLAIFAYAVGSEVRIRVWKDSISLWTDAIEKDNKVAVSYNNRASAYKELKKNELALMDYERAVKLNPDYVEALGGRGEIYRTVGRFDEALVDLNRALKIKPDAGWNILMSRAIVYCIKGRLDLAKPDFDQALKEEPKSAEIYCNLGNFYDMSGEYEKAIASYTKSIELSPKYEIAYLSRGTAKARKNYLKEGIIDLSKAIEYKPDYAEAYNDRSYAYNSLGDYEKALKDALKAKELGFKVDENYLKALLEKKK